MVVRQVLGGAAIAAVVALGVYVARTGVAVGRQLRTAASRPIAWIVGVPIMLLVTLVGAPFLYIQSISTPAPKALSFADLALPSATTTTLGATGTTAGTDATSTTLAAASRAVRPTTVTAPESPVAGTWRVGQGTQARYHIDDTVMGQTTHVVGSTPDVTGSMKIAGTTVTEARVVVNMQTVTCHCMHDSKYRDLLDVDVYPTSTFNLTQPIALSAIPPEGQQVNIPVTGSFTIHGVTRQVKFTLAALRQAGRIAINGTIPVRLEDYNIENPNAGAFGSLSNCYIEFLVAFDRA
ncbi:MAG TPA: YceI family protein [Acidimicrobiales bacterium]|nr:YceI family protein [Acidimicrobiales bacterium]